MRRGARAPPPLPPLQGREGGPILLNPGDNYADTGGWPRASQHVKVDATSRQTHVTISPGPLTAGELKRPREYIEETIDYIVQRVIPFVQNKPTT